MGEFFALLAGFFFSSSNLMIRQGMKILDRNSGHVVTLVVSTTMNLILLTVIIFLLPLPAVNGMGILYFSLAGFFTTFAGRLFLFASIEKIGASRAALFKVSAPMFTIFLGVIIMQDRFSLLDMLGSAVVLAGLYLLSCSEEIRMPQAPPVGIVPYAETAGKKETLPLNMGVVYGVLAGLSLSIGHIFRKLGLINIASPYIGVTVGSIVSLLSITTLLLVKNRDLRTVSGLFKQTLCFNKTCRNYFWGGFFNAIAQYLFFFSLIYTTVSIANILISTEALFNLLLVALFFRADEPLTPRLVFLSAFILAGVVLIMV